MLSALPINSDATLNNFERIESQDFVPGENKVFAWQIQNDERDLRYVLPATAIVTLLFNKVDGTSLTKTASFVDAGDRSLVQVTMAQDDTTDLVSGNISFSVDMTGDGTNLKKGVIYNALRRLDTSAC